MSSMAEQQQDHQLSSAASSIVGIDDFVAGLFLNDSPRDGGGGAGGGPTTPTFDLGPGTATEGDQGLVTEMEAFLGMSPGLREAHGAEQQTAQYLVPPLVYSPGPQMTAPPKMQVGDPGGVKGVSPAKAPFPWRGMPAPQQGPLPGSMFVMPTNAAYAANPVMIGAPSASSPDVDERRQRRLARNRESARQCRRRKKEYLDLLQDKVFQLNEEMIALRRAHLEVADPTLRQLRHHHLHQLDKRLSSPPLGQEIEPSPSIRHDIDALLSRFGPDSEERRALTRYRFAQLRDVFLPPHTRFLLWLLQKNEAFFRGVAVRVEPGGGGGPAVTVPERAVSANKRGEKLMQEARPSWEAGPNLWPLLCYELQIKSEQEERIRKAQHEMLEALKLSRREGGPSRIQEVASNMELLSSVESRMLSTAQAVQSKLGLLHQTLTPLQVVKLQLWKDKARGAIRQVAALRRQQQQQQQHVKGAAAGRSQAGAMTMGE